MMHDLRIEPDAQHLHEQPGALGAARHAGPERPRPPERQCGRDGARFERQSEFVRQHVGGAERDDTKPCG